MNALRHGLLSRSLVAAAAVLFPLNLALAVESPVTINKVTTDFEVGRDGSFTQIVHKEALARNAVAARQIEEVPIVYDELKSDARQIIEAYTLKPDGTKLPVDIAAISTRPLTGAQAIFPTVKQKIIVFPKVAAGDVIVYTAKSHVRTPDFVGSFSFADLFLRTTSYNDISGSIVASKSMPLTIEAHDVSVEKEDRGETVLYRWRYSAPDALAEDVADVAAIDRNPRVFVSSFASYDDLARAYAKMVAPAVAVTPKVQDLADSITSGISDRRIQAEKIYDWVSHNIRYGFIQLGLSGYVPHAAEVVLQDGYGDCKDHAALLTALLKAKGIDSDMVVINLGNSYSVPEKPNLASFNHVINWLPEFKLYVDSTIGVAPFGTLTFEEYGKPVIHAVTGGSALRKTPTVAAGVASMRFETKAKLDAAGNLTGETSTVASGPFGIGLRQYAKTVEAKWPGTAAAEQLRLLGFDGTGAFDFRSPAQPGPEYAMLGRFHVTTPQYLTGAKFWMPNGLRVLPNVSDLLMGPIDNVKLKDSEPTPCFTGTSVEQVSLEIPVGKRVLKLPSDITIADDHLRFTARWSVDGRVISVRREFIAVVDQPLCTGALRKAVAKSLTEIRQANRLELLSLIDDDASARSASKSHDPAFDEPGTPHAS
jgi:hypothetical protein